MEINVDKGDAKNGVLGLVLALVEIIKETLELQALKRVESGQLTKREIERLGLALKELNSAVEEIKVQCGAAESVREIREALDNAAGELLDQFTNPERWEAPRKAHASENALGPAQGRWA